MASGPPLTIWLRCALNSPSGSDARSRVWVGFGRCETSADRIAAERQHGQYDYQGAMVVANTLAKCVPDSPEAAAAAAQLLSLQAGEYNPRAENEKVAANEWEAAAAKDAQALEAKDQRYAVCQKNLKLAQKVDAHDSSFGQLTPAEFKQQLNVTTNPEMAIS